MPRLNGSRSTCAPRARATSMVRSAEPSSTTTISSPASYARISSMTRPTQSSSLKAGTTAMRRGSAMRGGLEDACQLQHATRAVRVRVLVEDALARTPAELLGPAGIDEQLAVRLGRLLGVLHDEHLAVRLEPPLDPLDRVRDDRGAGRGKLERTRGGGRAHRRVRAARDVQVDPRRGDRPREHVERHVADEPCVARVAAEVAAAEREVDLGRSTRGVADERLHPLAPELVPVAVEEDVVLLLDVVRTEEVGVGAP